MCWAKQDPAVAMRQLGLISKRFRYSSVRDASSWAAHTPVFQKACIGKSWYGCCPMASMIGPHERFPGAEQAVALLDLWRQQGPAAVRQGLEALNPLERQRCVLLQELWSRLEQKTGPRLLVDGIWWSQTTGGSVGSATDPPPLGLARSGAPNAPVHSFRPAGSTWIGQPWRPVPRSTAVRQRPGVLTCSSSWISSTGVPWSAACPELALVHDRIPERVQGVTPDQRRLRTAGCWGPASFGHVCGHS